MAGQYVSPDSIGLMGGDRPQGYVEEPGGWVDPLGLAQRLHAAVDQAAWDLEANPEMAKALMSRGSYQHLVARGKLTAATYGKTVERRAAQILQRQQDPNLRLAGKAPKGPDGHFIKSPDFFGANGAIYDVTKPNDIASHLRRAYGPTTNFATYPGLPPNHVIPQ